jgi:two-component system sensor histidine kinase AgrC
MEYYLKLLATIILLYITILNLSFIEIKVKEFIGTIVVADTLSYLLFYATSSEFVAIIPVLIIPIILLYLRSKNIIKSISLPVFSLILAVLSDNLISGIYTTLSKGNGDNVYNNNLTYFIGYMVTFIFIYILSKFLSFILYKKTKLLDIDLKGTNGLLMLLSLLLTVVIFYSNIILSRRKVSAFKIYQVNDIMFLAYFVLLIVFMYILIKSLTKELDLRNKQEQFENLKQYTTNLESLYSDMRSFRHDYINILASMVGFIQNDDMDGLRTHFNSKIMPLSNSMENNNFKIGNLKNIQVPEIKGILSSKLIRAQEMGIEVHIEITEPIKDFNMDIMDLSRGIGILVDNSIEAAIECDEPNLEFAIINEEKHLKILIINSCSDKTPPIYKIYENGFSTKGNGRGIGLYNLKKMLSKYKKASLDTIIEEGKFKQILYISKM